MIIRKCTACGQNNRIPAAKLTASGRCGKCKQPLAVPAEPLDVGTKELHEILSSATVPVLIDFWAAWCAPCRAAAPEVVQTARAMQGRAVVVKVDTEANPELSAEFGVRGIPNFVVINNGKVVMQQAGLVDHRQMQDWLESALKTEALP